MELPTQNWGVGIGLRAPHYQHILDERPKDIDWLEILSDNYLNAHEGYWQMLADLASDYPFMMHGVSLSIGAADAIDVAYVQRLKKLAEYVDAKLVSDHLCFTSMNGHQSHDLLPVPYTKEALTHIIPRIHQVQDILQRPLVLENASSYVTYDADEMDEPQFFTELHRATGCGILLDLNNVYVSSYNHNWDMKRYIAAMPKEAVVQYHLGGHANKGSHCIDTHGAAVIDPVWELYRFALDKIGARSTLIEWDTNVPELSVLVDEAKRARQAA